MSMDGLYVRERQEAVVRHIGADDILGWTVRPRRVGWNRGFHQANYVERLKTPVAPGAAVAISDKSPRCPNCQKSKQPAGG